jgi:hypothetical protein
MLQCGYGHVSTHVLSQGDMFLFIYFICLLIYCLRTLPVDQNLQRAIHSLTVQAAEGSGRGLI